MKNYEKPMFTLVSLTANSAFCSCNVDTGGISIPGLFGDGLLGCVVDIEDVYEGYCKNNANGEVLMSS